MQDCISIATWHRIKKKLQLDRLKITHLDQSNSMCQPIKTRAIWILNFISQSFDLGFWWNFSTCKYKPYSMFLYTQESSVTVYRSGFFQALLKYQLGDYMQTSNPMIKQSFWNHLTTVTNQIFEGGSWSHEQGNSCATIQNRKVYGFWSCM